MSGDLRLMRISYRTDRHPDLGWDAETDPDYWGAFSDTIPASAFRDGQTIVGVDWTEPGWVHVTFLVPR